MVGQLRRLGDVGGLRRTTSDTSRDWSNQEPPDLSKVIRVCSDRGTSTFGFEQPPEGLYTDVNTSSSPKVLCRWLLPRSPDEELR